MSDRDHLVYGLRVRSARALPGLIAVPPAGEADVQVYFEPIERPSAAEPWQVIYVSDSREGDRPTVSYEQQGGAGSTRLVYGEGVRFALDRSASRIWVEWDAPLTLVDAMIFLTGPVLGLVLRRRGVLALHASAVVIGNEAIGFVGAGGAGKSTLAAALAVRGHAVLTDDVLALRPEASRWWATPGYDHLRIWEASEGLLYGTRNQLAPASDTWEKRLVRLSEQGYRHWDEAVPLGGLIVLDAPDPARRASAVVDAKGGETLLALLGNSYAGYLLGADEREAEVTAVGALLRQVPVAHLVPAVSGATPSALAALIEEWRATARAGPRQ